MAHYKCNHCHGKIPSSKPRLCMHCRSEVSPSVYQSKPTLNTWDEFERGLTVWFLYMLFCVVLIGAMVLIDVYWIDFW